MRTHRKICSKTSGTLIFDVKLLMSYVIMRDSGVDGLQNKNSTINPKSKNVMKEQVQHI